MQGAWSLVGFFRPTLDGEAVVRLDSAASGSASRQARSNPRELEKWVMDTAMNDNATLLQVVANHADRILLQCDDGEAFAYAAVAGIAAEPAFCETRRALVFCLCDNDPGGILGYFGLLYANAVPMMISAGLPADRLRDLFDIYRPAYVWLPESRIGEFAAAKITHRFKGYCLLATSVTAQAPLNDALALLLGTSGSTGNPKFVRLSHANLLANARSIVTYLQIGADEKPITTLPPTYSYGLSILNSHVLAGSTIALTAKTFFDRGFWDFLKATAATSFGGVPYHYEMLKKLRFAKMELPSLRYVTQAGGRMEPDAMRDFAAVCAAMGVRFFSMYGQTEATARMSYLEPEKAEAKAGSIGRAIPGGRFRLQDDTGRDIEAPETTGELVYEGPNVCLGYAESRADLALGDENGSVLRTGDLARRDPDGDYIIVGRLKRFLKLFGYRVNLQDIENGLRAGGHAVACAGRDDFLEIYLPQGTVEVGRAVKAGLVAELKVSPTAIGVYGVANLPRSDAGKIQYGQLGALVRETLA